MIESIGVPYGSRTRVAAVKEKQPNVIQRNLAAWIALYRTSRTHGNAYWTFNGRALATGFINLLTTDFKSVVCRESVGNYSQGLPQIKHSRPLCHRTVGPLLLKPRYQQNRKLFCFKFP